MDLLGRLPIVPLGAPLQGAGLVGREPSGDGGVGRDGAADLVHLFDDPLGLFGQLRFVQARGLLVDGGEGRLLLPDVFHVHAWLEGDALVGRGGVGTLRPERIRPLDHVNPGRHPGTSFSLKFPFFSLFL